MCYLHRFDDASRITLADVADAATKTLLHEAGWGSEPVEAERRYDLRARLDEWMAGTHDPILLGPIPPDGLAVAGTDLVSATELKRAPD